MRITMEIIKEYIWLKINIYLSIILSAPLAFWDKCAVTPIFIGTGTGTADRLWLWLWPWLWLSALPTGGWDSFLLLITPIPDPIPSVEDGVKLGVGFGVRFGVGFGVGVGRTPPKGSNIRSERGSGEVVAVALDITTLSWSSSLYSENEAYSGTRLVRPDAASPKSFPLREKDNVPNSKKSKKIEEK